MAIMLEAPPAAKTVPSARACTRGDVLNLFDAAFEECGWEITDIALEPVVRLTVRIDFGREIGLTLDLSALGADDDVEEAVPYDHPSWGEDVAVQEVGYGLKERRATSGIWARAGSDAAGAGWNRC